ncbi:hypothetical protein ACIBG7_29415 [Nonomuraea sp. NPDC050328]|uniref:hypothetical protein n=1 Tax=Nonomuraea sp. NPDC050328 TaxID=3364361 RepID=UPI0037B0CF1A
MGSDVVSPRRPNPPKRSLIGDLPMRVIYRGLAVVAALGAVVVWALPSGPGEDAARPVAAPSAVPSSSGPAPVTPSPEVSPAFVAPTPTPTPSPTAAPSIAPGYTAMEALYADPRVPKLPARLRAKAVRGYRPAIKDRFSGLAVPRLPRPWRTYGSGPYATRQIIKGTRALFVTAPVPIKVQREHRDTALLAARWTLSRHPKGARLTWIDSRPIRDGWMLVYKVRYGKRSALAAVVVAKGGASKPGLAFISVPDTRKRQWGQVARVAAGVRALG